LNLIQPKKLLLSKWTASVPIAKNKHFLISKIIQPELPTTTVEWVELEAVYSKAVTRIRWQDLRDDNQWKQGWM
jgi:tryptophan-rich hypothetical protein